MTKKITIILLGMFICSVIVKADDSIKDIFIGIWYVDVDKTVQEIKKDPRNKNDGSNRIKKGIKLMAGMTTFKVTDKSISFVMDIVKMFPNAKKSNSPKSPVYPYDVIHSDNSSMSIKYSKGTTAVQMTLSLIDDKHIRAVSLGSPEYNNIVWQKNRFVPSPQKAETIHEKDIIGIVLGKPIGVKQKKQMKGMIFGALLKKFAEEHKIESTDAELDSFCKKMEELKPKDKKQNKEQEEQAKFMMRQLGKSWVLRWKINKALYEKYGGRVIFQQAGSEPIDAYRDFLKEEGKKGNFKILDKKDEVDFWRYYTNDAMHSFYSKEDGEKFINTPFWLMKKPSEGRQRIR